MAGAPILSLIFPVIIVICLGLILFGLTRLPRMYDKNR